MSDQHFWSPAWQEFLLPYRRGLYEASDRRLLANLPTAGLALLVPKGMRYSHHIHNSTFYGYPVKVMEDLDRVMLAEEIKAYAERDQR